TALQTRITALDNILKRLHSDVIPLAYFAQASLYNKLGDNETQIAAIYDTMQERFPLNKYTNALRALRSGNPVRLVDPIEEAQELRLDNALGLVESAPDSMRVILEELTVSDYAHIRLKANFRLGWHYSIETQDTTAAKPYLDEALKLEQTGDYATLIRKIYDGTSFVFNRPRTVPDSLKADEAATEEDKEKAESELDEDARKPDPEEIIADVDEADKPKPEDEIPPPEPQIDDEEPTDAEPIPILPDEQPIPEDETPPTPPQPVIPPLE
ncbi:MAG: hypothetical protein U1B83_00995, partial [Candidatus Cloacimonadaceae bacterium]|nr:hypothetical protein [Candidatus Cloacimonadaceae bacterium]